MSLLKFPQISIDPSGESTRLVRSGLFFGVLLCIIFFIWGMTAPIQGAVVTSGVIKIDSNRKTIQHLEGGIIKKILVREGSQVDKNQPLLILENISTSSQFYILTDRLYAAKAKEARLQAQQKKLKRIVFPVEYRNSTNPIVKKIGASEVELFNSKRKNRDDQINLLNFEITQTKLESQGLAQEKDAIKAGIGFIKQQLDASRSLKKKGYIDKSAIWDLQRTLAEKNERIGSLLAEEAVAQSKITTIRLKIITLENNYSEESNDQLKETQQELREIQELLRPVKYAFDRSAVVAPQAGQVINIKVNTIGGVVRPGEELMELVPNKKDLIIEGKLATSDIDSVHLNQLANIQLLAYSSRNTPMLRGKVIYISEDVIEESAEPGVYYYLCHIQVDKTILNDLPDNVKLLPGMPVTAFIQTRARTFMSFILEPIITHTRRALREE